MVSCGFNVFCIVLFQALLDLHQYDLTIQVYNQAFELARDNADIVVFKGWEEIVVNMWCS